MKSSRIAKRQERRNEMMLEKDANRSKRKPIVRYRSKEDRAKVRSVERKNNKLKNKIEKVRRESGSDLNES